MFETLEHKFHTLEHSFDRLKKTFSVVFRFELTTLSVIFN